MLNSLRKALFESHDVIFEAVNETPDEVKQQFMGLDDEIEVGSEDKHIEELVNSVPEDEDIDVETLEDEDIQDVVEAFESIDGEPIIVDELDSGEEDITEEDIDITDSDVVSPAVEDVVDTDIPAVSSVMEDDDVFIDELIEEDEIDQSDAEIIAEDDDFDVQDDDDIITEEDEIDEDVLDDDLTESDCPFC